MVEMTETGMAMNHKFFKPGLVLMPGLAFALIWIAVLGALAAPPRAAWGQDAETGQDQTGQAPTGQTGPAWKIRCSEDGDPEKPQGGKCEMFQKLVVADTGQRVAEFAIGVSGEGDRINGVVVLPLGILLKTGAILQVDGLDPFTFSPRYCDAGGCVAFINVNEKLLDMMRKGNDALVKLRNPNGDNINIQFSLKGFSKTLDKIN